MEYSLLKELISRLEEYHENHSSNKIEDFTIWMNNKLFAPKDHEDHSAHDELLIAFKLMHLNKELKKQTKKVLSESHVSSVDEYSFLLHLEHQESFRKMELIDLHNIEAPTGIEIIKRLLKNNFIEEFPDMEDKRARRIKITTAGIEEVKSLKPKVDRVFSKLTEPLSLDQKIQMSGIFDMLIK